jgi:hypothetical protein
MLAGFDQLFTDSTMIQQGTEVIDLFGFQVKVKFHKQFSILPKQLHEPEGHEYQQQVTLWTEATENRKKGGTARRRWNKIVIANSEKEIVAVIPRALAQALHRLARHTIMQRCDFHVTQSYIRSKNNRSNVSVCPPCLCGVFYGVESVNARELKEIFENITRPNGITVNYSRYGEKYIEENMKKFQNPRPPKKKKKAKKSEDTDGGRNKRAKVDIDNDGKELESFDDSDSDDEEQDKSIYNDNDESIK